MKFNIHAYRIIDSLATNHENQVTDSAIFCFWHPSCSESNCAPAEFC